MQVEKKGYDPFWGADPYQRKEPERVKFEKTNNSIASEDESDRFFETYSSSKTTDQRQMVGRNIDIKV